MIIGYLGDIVFSVSKNLVRTFDSFNRSGFARWATHEVVGDKPLLEFLGPGVEEISFEMQLSTSLGVTPEEELAKLRALRDDGKPAMLIINGEVVGDHDWAVEALTETVTYWGKGGKMLSAKASATLKEVRE